MFSIKPNKGFKDPPLFDIRVHSSDNDDVILVQGSPDTAEPVLLSGTIVLSLNETIQIKRLALRLYGWLTMNVPVDYKDNKGHTKTRTVKSHRRLYYYNWNDILIENYFQNLYSNYNNHSSIDDRPTTSQSDSANMRKKSKSTTSLLSLPSSSSGQSNYRTLLKGNYEFPFNTILPGSLPESVEGLPNARVSYHLEAVVERHKLPDLVSKKHIRVVRTITPDSSELSETVAVENQWPAKVDYTIAVDARSLAIGSVTNINMMFAPLVKGLKLGPIKISLLEIAQLTVSNGGASNSATKERIVMKKRIKDPICHPNSTCSDGEIADDIGSSEYQDKWELKIPFQLPASLTKCTQDCVIYKNIRVRHKMKFVICLINPDGHVSELRASLPVQLYISPFVALLVRNISGSASSLPDLAKDELIDDDTEGNDVIFGRGLTETGISTTSMPSIMVPPNYGRHVFDRLCGENNNASLSTSHNDPDLLSNHNEPYFVDVPNDLRGFSPSPVNHTTYQSGGTLNDYSAVNSQSSLLQLNQNLNSLNLDSEGRNILNDDLYAISNEGTDMSRVASSAFLHANAPERSGSPLMFDDIHISRANSFLYQSSNAGTPSNNPEWKVTKMSRVPSYQNAMKADAIGDDLPPRYSPSTEEVPPRDSLSTPQGARHRSTSLLGASSHVHLNQLTPLTNDGDRNKSSNSVASLGFAFSATNVQSHNKSESQKKLFSGSNPSARQNTDTRDKTNKLQRSGSESSSMRIGSFPNFLDILTKGKQQD